MKSLNIYLKMNMVMKHFENWICNCFSSVYALYLIISLYLIRYAISRVASTALKPKGLITIYCCGVFLLRILRIYLRSNHLYKKRGLISRLTKTVNAYLFMINVEPVRSINIKSVTPVRLLRIYVLARAYVIRQELSFIVGIQSVR